MQPIIAEKSSVRAAFNLPPPLARLLSLTSVKYIYNIMQRIHFFVVYISRASKTRGVNNDG